MFFFEGCQIKCRRIAADDRRGMAKKKSRLGCLFYLALVLLALVIFLFNQKNVQEVMERTGFWQLFQKQPQSPPRVVISPLNGQPKQEKPPQKQKDEKEVIITVQKDQQAEERQKQEKPQPKERKARLFFVQVAEDGKISLKGTVRTVQYSDAPLKSTLEALMKGPTPAELNQGLITLIPAESRIYAIRIQGDTATLDFNEAFRFNSLGREGLTAQLKQVVYAVTEFSNLQKVQILIEGKSLTYLGPEGVFIGKPLSRVSFTN